MPINVYLKKINLQILATLFPTAHKRYRDLNFTSIVIGIHQFPDIYLIVDNYFLIDKKHYFVKYVVTRMCLQTNRLHVTSLFSCFSSLSYLIVCQKSTTAFDSWISSSRVCDLYSRQLFSSYFWYVTFLWFVSPPLIVSWLVFRLLSRLRFIIFVPLLHMTKHISSRCQSSPSLSHFGSIDRPRVMSQLTKSGFALRIHLQSVKSYSPTCTNRSW